MAQQNDFDEEAARRDYRAPYSHDHPIPTIQRYREHRQELDEQHADAENAPHTTEDDSRMTRAYNSVKAITKDEDKNHPAGNPYPTASRHAADSNREPGQHDNALPDMPAGETHPVIGKEDEEKIDHHGPDGPSATEKAAQTNDPRQKRKEMNHNKGDDGGREVTDPVTHLPLVIRDSTAKDLKRAPENELAPGLKKKTATKLSHNSNTSSKLSFEQQELQKDYEGMQKMFPPPSFEATRAELARTYQIALSVGLGAIVMLATLVVLLLLVLNSRTGNAAPLSGFGIWRGTKQPQQSSNWPFIPLSITIVTAFGLGFAVIFQIQGWLGKKVAEIWEDEIWDAARLQEANSNASGDHLPESVAWMNSLLSSVWPLINPDLFASVTDMLEDVMQASLPKVVRMVSVDDLGQGSEAIRILGIRWLPTGAADKSVDEEGNLKESSGKETNDRTVPGEGEEEENHEEKLKDEDEDVESQREDKKKQQERKKKEEQQEAMREGMEAEQGDFVNMEVAFSYRARSSGKSLKSKAKNAHLYLKFYLPGGIFVPVWVELRGIIGTMRLRLQLTPDPPFFSLCTVTFLGQPKADLSCVPLSRHLPNLMNVPLISTFVQTSIDAALAEYVAPKSLTLDLKDMLVGDDFKKDTFARGIIVIFIKEASGFKEGDGGFGPIKGSSDGYVTCSWGKFGKTVSSTRIIEKDQNPKWHEWAYMLVSPKELNAEEKLRLQLWDSDKLTADDDLGRVEVDLKELMHSPETRNKFHEREDRFRAQDPDEKMPGTLQWSVAYYEKLRITEDQLTQQKLDTSIKTKDDLKELVAKEAERKLREATAHDESKGINQQKVQDYRERENSLICAAPPSPEYPSGILSIQIHNITGLEVEALQKREKNSDLDREDEGEQSDDLPSSYCTIILNHKKIYMTRTKPKNAKPFFNAGTERYVRDWRTCEIMISCRDSRERETDALLGIVYLPLAKIFHKRSQIMDTYPLVGGIGFGRVRISMIFRSLEMQLPHNLLGWDYGTLEIRSPVVTKGTFQHDAVNRSMKLRTNMAKLKMSVSEGGKWHLKNNQESGFLPVRKRYASSLIIEFRKSSFGSDTTPALAVFWLKDMPDEEEQIVTLQVWKGGKENLKRATTCAGYEGLDKGEAPLGEIEITMKFWRGLSGYHKTYARGSGNEDMKNVMEVLDTVNDEYQEDYSNLHEEEHDDNSDDDSNDDESENHHTKGTNTATSTTKKPNQKLKNHTNASDSDSDPEDGETKNPLKKVKEKLHGHNDSDDGSRGLISQWKDYKDHRKQLHRKHRGVMQWKFSRTADWALSRAKRGVGKLENAGRHSEKNGQAIETEV